eukprot:4531661-Pyramimonas_sp.AAC.1
MGRYQELHGAREPSDEMKPFDTCAFLQASSPATGMRSYQWPLYQVESLMMRDREKWAISEQESTLNSRNRQARLAGGVSEGAGGGRRSSAMAATTRMLGLPT